MNSYHGIPDAVRGPGRYARRLAGPLFVLLLVGAMLALSWGQLPVLAIDGDSMEPTYSQGDAIVVDSVDPSTIEEGDVVVYTVPSAAQFEYGYPETVVHRVVDVDRPGSQLVFRTAGDNTGTDPFDVRADLVRGTVAYHVPYLGYVFLYLQSLEGRIFIGFTVILYAAYHIAPRLHAGLKAYVEDLLSTTSGTVIDPGGAYRADIDRLDDKFEQVDDSMERVEEALEAFAGAMNEYAVHLQSHTSAVQQLESAADNMERLTASQTAILEELAETLRVLRVQPSNASDPHRQAFRDDRPLRLGLAGSALFETNSDTLQRRDPAAYETGVRSLDTEAGPPSESASGGSIPAAPVPLRMLLACDLETIVRHRSRVDSRPE